MQQFGMRVLNSFCRLLCACSKNTPVVDVGARRSFNQHLDPCFTNSFSASGDLLRVLLLAGPAGSR